MSTTPQKGELGYEFPHPGNGRTLRLVRANSSRVDSVAEECQHCAVFAACSRADHPHHDALYASCGFVDDYTAAVFVAYVEDIPTLAVKGILA